MERHAGSAGFIFLSVLKILLLLAAFRGPHALAENVSFGSTKSDKVTDAKLGRPANISPTDGAPGVVILHHGGGCINSQTPKYAEALNKAGYFTIEPCLFTTAGSRERSTVVYLPQVFGALRYLANLPGVDKNRIAITGGSYGAALTFVSATKWAYETHADSSLPPFAAHAPFYPGCYIYERFFRDRKGRADLPADAYDKFTRAPIRIYAGGRDDYDSRDPKACEVMISLLAPENKKLVTLRMFLDATHGWDHQVSATFYEPLACKGRGCTNINSADSATTQEGIADLIEFLGEAMPAK